MSDLRGTAMPASPRRVLAWPALLVALLWGVAGCTVGPDYKRPEILTPTEWRNPKQETGSLAGRHWWQLFQDSVLQELIRTAFYEDTFRRFGFLCLGSILLVLLLRRVAPPRGPIALH